MPDWGGTGGEASSRGRRTEPCGGPGSASFSRECHSALSPGAVFGMAGRIPLSTPDKRGSHIVYWIAVAVLAGVGVALFVLPHHKGDSGFGSLARDFGEILT